jgi:hypothetical protein
MPTHLQFMVLTVQVTLWHVIATQFLFAQSEATLHDDPTGHPPHGPPQSVPVSPLFCTKSVQLAGGAASRPASIVL